MEGENVLEVSGEEIPSLELADQIAVYKCVPVTEPSSMSVDTSSTTMSMSTQQPQCEMEEVGRNMVTLYRMHNSSKTQP